MTDQTPPSFDRLESQEFYELCQAYRWAEDSNGDAGKAFEALKDFCRTTDKTSLPGAAELIALALKCGAFQNEGGHGIPAGTLITFEPDELEAFAAALSAPAVAEQAATQAEAKPCEYFRPAAPHGLKCESCGKDQRSHATAPTGAQAEPRHYGSQYGPDGKPFTERAVSYVTVTEGGGFKQISKQEHDRFVAEADDAEQAAPKAEPVKDWHVSVADLIFNLHQWQAAPAGEASTIAWDRLQQTINSLATAPTGVEMRDRLVAICEKWGADDAADEIKELLAAQPVAGREHG